MPPEEAAIEARGLRRVYRERKSERVALDAVDLELKRGERLALLGPNGSGKSTLLRILATLDVPDAGELRLLGDDGRGRGGWRGVRRRLGVTFQQPGLDKLLTVRENLLASAALYGSVRAGACARKIVEESARALNIADRLDSRVGSLSGGLARRADLARSLLHGPELLLLDEPTTGLDPAARAEFLDHLDEIAARDGNMTLLMTTHLMDEAERCDRVAFMDAGKIVALDTPAGLRDRLGEAVLRISAHAGSPARAAALQIARAEGLSVEESERTVLARGDRAALARAAAALIERGADWDLVAVEVAPPTLDDAFAAVTGRSLVARLSEPGGED